MQKSFTTSLIQEAICEHWFMKAKEAINVDGG